MTEEMIEPICKQCRYYQKGCFFEKGDSLTKLPCQALIELAKNKASAEEEWEIEILAFIKGKQKTSDAAFELVELLSKYPYTYFDIKVAPCKPDAAEKWRIRAQKETTK